MTRRKAIKYILYDVTALHLLSDDFDIFSFIFGYVFPMYFYYLAVTCYALITSSNIMFLMCGYGCFFC